MRKTIFLFALLAGTLSLQAQNYPLRARLSDPNSFSVIVIPDPQSYTKFAANQPLFELQTAWIAREIDSLRILTALCTGDLVEQNETAIPLAFRKTDQTSAEPVSYTHLDVYKRQVRRQPPAATAAPLRRDRPP